MIDLSMKREATNMKKNTFRKGQKVVCTHYKDQPIVTITSIDIKENQVWVYDPNPIPLADNVWYGPTEWFKKVSK